MNYVYRVMRFSHAIQSKTEGEQYTSLFLSSCVVRSESGLSNCIKALLFSVTVDGLGGQDLPEKSLKPAGARPGVSFSLPHHLLWFSSAGLAGCLSLCGCCYWPRRPRCISDQCRQQLFCLSLKWIRWFSPSLLFLSKMDWCSCWVHVCVCEYVSVLLRACLCLWCVRACLPDCLTP